MANFSAPRGFVPVRHLNGSPFNGQYKTFIHLATDSTAIFIGDLVKITATSGLAGSVISGMDVEGIPAVILATAQSTGQDIVGVVCGFAQDQTIPVKYCAASTARVVFVITDPTVVYQIQEDAVTTPITTAMIGMNYAYTSAAGSTVTGVSAYTITSTSQATSSVLPVKVIGLTKRPGNAFNTAGGGTDPATFDVILNTTFFATNSAGV